MEENPKSAVMINLTEKQIALGVAKHLKPLLREEINSILTEKKEDEAKPISMAEAAHWLGLSRTTFSGIVGKGEIKYKSLNPENPKASKFFLIKDLRRWLETNRAITIDELKSSTNG